MKNESGPASHGTVFKAAVVLMALFVLVILRHGLSSRSARPIETVDPSTAPADTFEPDATSDGSSDANARPTPRASRASHAAPVRVQPFRGQYCASVGPPGWAVIAENPQRAAFGADLASGDGLAFAGYSIFPAGSIAPPGSETPSRAVANTLTAFGTVQVRFGRHLQLAPNVFLLEYVSATNHGVAFYQAIPAGGDGYMIVMRMAGTGTSPGQWEKRSAEAMAVARSLVCQVPMVPAGPDPPGLNAKPEHGSNNGEDTDTLYNTWLEREYYHNPQSGENYWVSPSENYSQTGPDGPGYYATYGGNLIKLSPGYAQ
ncbi:MAG: hypothetical protein ACLQVG_15300 [Terriglobia bacterium]